MTDASNDDADLTSIDGQTVPAGFYQICQPAPGVPGAVVPAAH
jgi:hypothetical protein